MPDDLYALQAKNALIPDELIDPNNPVRMSGARDVLGSEWMDVEGLKGQKPGQRISVGSGDQSTYNLGLTDREEKRVKYGLKLRKDIGKRDEKNKKLKERIKKNSKDIVSIESIRKALRGGKWRTPEKPIDEHIKDKYGSDDIYNPKGLVDPPPGGGEKLMSGEDAPPNGQPIPEEVDKPFVPQDPTFGHSIMDPPPRRIEENISTDHITGKVTKKTWDEKGNKNVRTYGPDGKLLNSVDTPAPKDVAEEAGKEAYKKGQENEADAKEIAENEAKNQRDQDAIAQLKKDQDDEDGGQAAEAGRAKERHRRSSPEEARLQKEMAEDDEAFLKSGAPPSEAKGFWDRATDAGFNVGNSGVYDLRPFMKIIDDLEGTKYAENNLNISNIRSQRVNEMATLAKAGGSPMKALEMKIKMQQLGINSEKLEHARNKLKHEIEKLEEKKKTGGLTKLQAEELEIKKLRRAQLEALQDNNWKRPSMAEEIEEARRIRRKGDREEDIKDRAFQQSNRKLGFVSNGKVDFFKYGPKEALRLKRLPAQARSLLYHLTELETLVDDYPNWEWIKENHAMGRYREHRSAIALIIKEYHEFGALQKAEFEFIDQKIGDDLTTVLARSKELWKGRDGMKGALYQYKKNVLRDLDDAMLTYEWEKDDKGVFDSHFQQYYDEVIPGPGGPGSIRRAPSSKSDEDRNRRIEEGRKRRGGGSGSGSGGSGGSGRKPDDLYH